jgi:hypothetical protein
LVPGNETWIAEVVDIDFRWIILPAFLYVIITLFFVATIITTRSAPTWKNSSLPLLHVVDSQARVDGCGENVRKQAKNTPLILRQRPGGWQMVTGEEKKAVNV